MVSLNRRFDPAVQIARKWIAEQSSPPISFDAAMRRRDRTEPDFIWSTGVHLTDLVCWLVGPLAEIGNRSGMIDISPTDRRVEERVEIIGDEWRAKFSTGTHHPWSVVCTRAGDGEGELKMNADPSTPTFVRNGTADETATFLRGVLSGGAMPGPSVADAMPGTQLAAAMQRSVSRPATMDCPDE